MTSTGQLSLASSPASDPVLLKTRNNATDSSSSEGRQKQETLCCCCCCMNTLLAPLTNVPAWAAFGLAYFAWAAFGFLFGFHWLVVVFCVARRRADRLWGIVYMLCTLLAVAAVAGGGTYCRETSTPCPNGTDMSHMCLFSVQTPTYRRVYIFHFVGLAWLVGAWIVDGLQLWHWVRTGSGCCCASTRQRSVAADTASSPIKSLSEGQGSASGPQPLTLLYSKHPLAGPAYFCILFITTLLVTCTWTLIVTDWTTDLIPAGSPGTSLSTLGGFLVLEIVSCATIAACVLNFMRLC